MDINELQAGTTIFIPVFLKGGLVWTGDSHCRQGNGEVNLTALECSYREIVMQLIVRKDMKAEFPAHRDADPLHHDRLRRGPEQGDGDRGARERSTSLAAQKMVPLTRYEAYSLTSMVGDLPGEPGGGRPQGRALHGAQEHLRQEVVVRGAPRRRAALAGRRSPRGGGGPPLPVVTTTTDLKALVEAVGGDPRAP